MSKEKFSIGSETVIGMVHCLPLPTTAGLSENFRQSSTGCSHTGKSRSGCSDRRKYGRHPVFSATE